MTSERERAEFEKWARIPKADGPSWEFFDREPAGNYEAISLECAWAAWQAVSPTPEHTDDPKTCPLCIAERHASFNRAWNEEKLAEAARKIAAQLDPYDNAVDPDWIEQILTDTLGNRHNKK